MTPARKRRLWMATLIVLASAVGASIVVVALQQNMTFLHSPSEVVAGKVPADARFRLGGIVREGSVQRQTGSLKVSFMVTDRFHDFPVSYDGILPDMFSEGTSVIATGRITEGRLVADEILAKHDENYMPAEVADAIAAAAIKDATARNAAPVGAAITTTPGAEPPGTTTAGKY